MVPEEWPILTPAELEPANPAPVAEGDRLSAVMADFFLDPRKRLTEQERALIGALLDGLIGWIADQIRSALPNWAAAANESDGHALRERLVGAGLLQRRDLMAVFLRSADEERIANVMRSRHAATPVLLQRLISSPDANVSAAAMELILARGRRRDRFGQPRLDFDDLPERVAGGLVHAVAAALRGTMVAVGTSTDIDRDLSGAAAALSARRDPGKAIGDLTRALVGVLGETDMLDEGLLGTALREGDIAVVGHGLAHLASIGGASAWGLLTSDRAGGAALLLRMAGVSRTFAAELIAAVGDQVGITDPAAGIRAFDSLDAGGVQATRGWMQLDAAYRSAAGSFGHG